MASGIRSLSRQYTFVFGCMDTINGRYLLNTVATYCAIPDFDICVWLDAIKSRSGKARIREVCGTVNYLQPGCSSLVSRGPFSMGGVAAHRPAVISVNMVAAVLAVTDLLARLDPFREEPNSAYAAVTFSLASMAFLYEAEEGTCDIQGERVGFGDVEPLLGLLELARRRR